MTIKCTCPKCNYKMKIEGVILNIHELKINLVCPKCNENKNLDYERLIGSEVYCEPCDNFDLEVRGSTISEPFEKLSDEQVDLIWHCPKCSKPKLVTYIREED
ncbi:hypothetical protein CO725_00815 [Vibrio parahaemolyticus]|uniref:hypothetical protein n=1 Tax=Vibrio parahaemolyticus TaxID=670 RepID=UPI000BE2C9C6|nr:hypothetical protein [Vibrio parahaemolyticus]ATI44227.1 hypothetical protein CO725_00815 [Vibrio parahaemolyticus]